MACVRILNHILEKEEIKMGNLVQQYIDIAKEKNPGEPEFLQTIEKVYSDRKSVV